MSSSVVVEQQSGRSTAPSPTVKPARPPAWHTYLDRVPYAISRFAGLVGIVSLLDAVHPHIWRPMWALSPILSGPAQAYASALTAVSGLLLLRVAAGLRKRKRVAWRVAVAACAGIALADALRAERRPVEAAVAAGLLAALVAARSRFTAHSDPRSHWFALRITAQLFAAAVTYGVVSLSLPGHVPPGTGYGLRLREVIASLVGAGDLAPIHGDRYADVLHATLLGFGMLILISAIALVLRPAQPQARLAAGDETALRELLQRHGARDSLGYFALRRDKSVIWSPTGKAAITYRVVSGVALASGDPLGDPEAWPGAIDAFRRHIDAFGWTPAVMGCGELAATVYQREYGLTALTLGDEAILHTADFSLDGRAMRGVRQACTRVRRAGYSVEVRRVEELTPAEIEELRAAAAEWRGEPIERGYSMALCRLGDPADRACVVVTARRDGVLRGLLHFVPWSEHGLSLDLMRRDRTSDNGLNEFMIATLMERCPALGVDRVSLNFAVFRDALERGAQIGAGPLVRLWRRLLLVASRWWQIESLYRFNVKFRPQWQPRFICYPAARDIPRVALAAMEAEAFIVRPKALNRMLGRG